MDISKADLKRAKPDDVIRLAKWLGLDIFGMSIHQVIKLVHWRITRSQYGSSS